MRGIGVKRLQGPSVLVQTDELSYLKIAGVAGGDVWITGGHLVSDGVFRGYEWPSIPIRNSGDISVKFLESTEWTPPVVSENQTTEQLRKRIDETFQRLRDLQVRARKKPRYLSERKQVQRYVQVSRNGDPVFSLAGEHVQFDIDWKPNEEVTLRVWSDKGHDDKTTKNTFVTEIDRNEEYIFRFGS